MRFVADFHLHSKYSRATSPRMEVENIDIWARKKGVQLLGTGDFTHPVWFKNLKEKLGPAESGLFKIKKTNTETRFILSSEVNCIYFQGGRFHKIHVVVLAPSFDIVRKINAKLEKVGNLSVDGRPILKLSARDLVGIVLNISKKCMIIPAHIYSPWFSLFGSRSGFNSLKECFGNYSKYIYAVETGLSSDPPMSWRNSSLDKVALISNGDSHSPENIGREANVFDTDLNYASVIDAIKSKNPKKFLYTIEFFPQEGKYYLDGHRSCNISLTPSQSKKQQNLCPSCGKPLVIGVLNRAEELSDRAKGFCPKGAIPFKCLIPLKEIIAEVLGVGGNTKKVKKEYDTLIKRFKNEFEILLNVSRKDLSTSLLSEITEGIIRARKGKVHIVPGYDGVYGKIKVFSQKERNLFSKQKTFI